MYEQHGMTASQSRAAGDVVLIHGLAASLHDWVDVIPALECEGYNCHAPDLLGHGMRGSSSDPIAINAENVYRDFAAWFDSCGFSQPVLLVGHSLGSYLSILLAINHPERVKALVLSSPFYSPGQMPSYLRRILKHFGENPRIFEKIPEARLRELIDLAGLFIRNGHQLPETVLRRTAADYKRARPEIFQIPQTIQDLTPLLPEIRKPCLVIWGGNDFTLGTSSFLRLARQIPGSTIATISQAGHVPHQTHPQIFNREMIAFFRSLETTAKT